MNRRLSFRLMDHIVIAIFSFLFLSHGYCLAGTDFDEMEFRTKENHKRRRQMCNVEWVMPTRTTTHAHDANICTIFLILFSCLRWKNGKKKSDDNNDFAANEKKNGLATRWRFQTWHEAWRLQRQRDKRLQNESVESLSVRQNGTENAKTMISTTKSDDNGNDSQAKKKTVATTKTMRH